MTTRGSWKRTEREVAARLGGERVPVSGRARGDVPDVRTGPWAVEVKHRKSLPQVITKAMSQAKAAVRGDQVPLVVLHHANHAWDDDYVVLRMKDFVDLYGEVEP